MMPYRRPEMVVLDNAANLIQGSKAGPTLEPTSATLRVIPDCELDD